MDLPVFSQIPALVLNKLGPEERILRKRKSVKFYVEDDSDEISEDASGDAPSEEVTSSGNESESQESSQRSSRVKSKQARPVLKKTEKRKTEPDKEESIEGRRVNPDIQTDDAITQTDPEPEPLMFSKSTQTDLDYPIDISANESYRSLGPLGFNSSIYQIRRKDGRQPPLKIGLTLPKGKKRVVFYPDD